jgi:hypothetical protein
MSMSLDAHLQGPEVPLGHVDAICGTCAPKRVAGMHTLGA